MFRALLMMLLGFIVRIEASVDDEGSENQADPDGKIPPGEGDEADPDESGEGDGELVVAIGKDPDVSDDDAEIMAPIDGEPPSTLIQDFRRKAREDARKLRALEQERDSAVAAASAKTVSAAPAAVVVGDKPTLENCGYDAEKFETELTAFHDRKRQVEEQERQRVTAAKADETAYGERLNSYQQGKGQLKVPNFDAAEKAVTGVLSGIQQSIIVKHAKNAALVVFALGNDPAKLKELAAISDPIEFGIKAREMELEIKTVKRTIKPEGKAPSGSGSGATAAGSTALARAEKEADATGDRSKVHAQRMAMRRAAQAAGK